MPPIGIILVGTETLSFDIGTGRWSGPRALVKRVKALADYDLQDAVEADLPYGLGSAYREFRWVAFKLDGKITQDIVFPVAKAGVLYG